MDGKGVANPFLQAKQVSTLLITELGGPRNHSKTNSYCYKLKLMLTPIQDCIEVLGPVKTVNVPSPFASTIKIKICIHFTQFCGSGSHKNQDPDPHQNVTSVITVYQLEKIFFEKSIKLPLGPDPDPHKKQDPHQIKLRIRSASK
jgi:hypothetical protein